MPRILSCREIVQNWNCAKMLFREIKTSYSNISSLPRILNTVWSFPKYSCRCKLVCIQSRVNTHLVCMPNRNILIKISTDDARLNQYLSQYINFFFLLSISRIYNLSYRSNLADVTSPANIASK